MLQKALTKKRNDTRSKKLIREPQGKTTATTRENKHSRFPGRHKTDKEELMAGCGYLDNY